MKNVKNKFEKAKSHFIEGVKHYSSENYLMAENEFLSSLDLIPNRFSAQINLAATQIKLNKHLKAKETLLKCMELEQNHYELYLYMGIIEINQNNRKEALINFNKAEKLNPNNLEVLTHLAYTLFELKKYEKAIFYFDKILDVKKECTEILLHKGIAYQELKNNNEALLIFKKIIELNSIEYRAYFKLGIIYMEISELQLALNCFERTIEINPHFNDVYTNLGVTLDKIGNHVRAMNYHEKATLLQPKSFQVWLNKGASLSNHDNYQEAINCYNKAIEIKTDYAEAYWNKSLAQLSSGDFFNGWKNYEYRWKVNSSDKVKLAKDLPVFNINRKSEKTFIWREQGLGDEILFSMMYADVKHICQDYIIQAEPRLLEIFTRTYPEIKFLSSNQDVAVNDCKQHIPAGSLSQYLRNSIDKFRDHNLLVASESLVEHFRAKLITSKNKLCGFSWKSVSKKTGAAKSFSLEDLLPIFRIPDITFLNLQYGNVENEINDFKNKYGVNIINLTNVDHFNDIESHLSLINVCDFVLSASNTTAHFSGALGKKTFIIAPNSQGLLWYWNMKDLNDFNLWYPSLKVFKQEKIRDWSIPVLSAKKEIINFIYI